MPNGEASIPTHTRAYLLAQHGVAALAHGGLVEVDLLLEVPFALFCVKSMGQRTWYRG
jgi:hypothetical protein